jgi:hypothetical protein
MVDIDPVRSDTQPGESFALDGEVLFVGGASGVSDEKRRHDAPPVLGRSGASFAPVTGNGGNRCTPVHPRRVVESSTERA